MPQTAQAKGTSARDRLLALAEVAVLEKGFAATSIDELMDSWAEFEDGEREFAGPPADYDLDKWGSGNIYYGPALMWHELRQQIGDEKFFEVVRAWPESQENRSSNRETLYQFFEKQTGEELSAFFDAWLLGEQSPPRD